MEDALTTRNGSVWVQPDGPNTQPHYLACVDVGDLAEPHGDVELIQCMSPTGTGWDTKGEKRTPPEAVTVTLDSLMFASASYLEDLNCPFSLFVMQNSDGRPDLFNNYVRAAILQHASVVSRTDSNLVNKLEENEAMMSLELTARPPVIRAGKMVLRKITTSETEPFNDVFMYRDPEDPACKKDGKYGVAVTDGSVYSANVVYTHDYGLTWTPAAVDPFSVSENVISVTAFPISSTVWRWLVAVFAPAGGQGEVAYSDDEGATWTVITIGGATAGDGAAGNRSLFSLDMHHIWLASANGSIYFSEDGGVTWTEQTDGAVTTEDLNAVYFIDEDEGMAGGDADAILHTTNGGETWEIATATASAADVLAIAESDGFWWVATDDGEIWYSDNDGLTWTQRAGWTGSGVGIAADIVFMNSLVGFLLTNSAVPTGSILRTLDGGYSWEPMTTPTNTGLNALFIISENEIVAVGEVSAGTAVIIKGDRA